MKFYFPSAIVAIIACLSFDGNSIAGDPLDEMEAASRAPDLIWAATPPHHVKPQAVAGPQGYSPSQIAMAYNFYALPGTGAGQKIAIIDAYGSSTIQSDLNTFCAQYGLPKTTVSIVYSGGKPSGSNSDWALESSLDVEWAHAIAPGAQIILVVTKSASFSDLLAGVDYAVSIGANEVSMSWAGSEFSGEAYYDSHFNKKGVFFTASSGDSGAGANWPAVSPYVIGVGGTTLKLTALGAVISETAWNGSGGGVSAYEPRPAFQNGWNTKSGRGVPDVSYLADPNTGVAVYMTHNPYSSSGWVELGGTSVGAPQWAALIAIANGFHTFSAGDSAVSSLYVIGGMDYSYFFRDVTQGNNGGYSAGAKYDFVTGLGSPLADDIALYLGRY